MMIGERFFREITDNVWDAEAPHRRNGSQPALPCRCSRPCRSCSVIGQNRPTRSISRADLNDHIAEVVRENPERFAGLGTFPCRIPISRRASWSVVCANSVYAVLRSERMSTRMTIGTVPIAAISITIRSKCSGKRRSNWTRRSLSIHGTCSAKTRMPKYWLPWLVGMPAETSLAICSMMFGGVFERFPELRVAFAHGGGGFPSQLGRIEHGFTCARSCRGRQRIDPRNCLAGQRDGRSSTRALLCRLISPRSRGPSFPLPPFRCPTGRARI